MDKPVDDSCIAKTPANPEPSNTFRPKWERSLPARLTIASLEDKPGSLKLKVSIETTDTGETKSITSLIDSGATGNFIDREYVKANRLTTRTLSKPIPVFNVDGTPNEAGSITEVADLILRYKNHSERTLFAITGLGRQNLILGHTWLQKHNPEINWETREVKMSRCTVGRCTGCQQEIREERKVQKAEMRRITRCSTGPFPTFTNESDGDDELPALERDPYDDDDIDDPGYEDGDRLFATGLHAPLEEIRASSTISQ
jgi:hypothetical protein